MQFMIQKLLKLLGLKKELEVKAEESSNVLILKQPVNPQITDAVTQKSNSPVASPKPKKRGRPKKTAK